MSIGWIVAYSKAGREFYAAENLTRQSVEYYLPHIIETVSQGRRGQKHNVAKAVPLFPRYIFVHINHQWRHLLSTFGVSGVILTGEEPAFVGQTMIDRLKSRQDKDGIVTLPKASDITHGDKVKIIHGPFAGAIGIVEGMSPKDRQNVLLDYLGRKVSVLIGEDLLQKVA